MAAPFDPTAGPEPGRLEAAAVGGRSMGASAAERTFSAYHLQDFFAQEAFVEVVPRFTMPVVEGIAGSFGPFTPNVPVVIPLWLAVYLRMTNTCTITPPPFMDVEFLGQTLARELESDADFQPLHFHFFEIVRVMMRHAAADVQSGGEVQRLVAQIRERREAKIRASLGMFEQEPLATTGIRVSNLVGLEIEFLRTTLGRVLDDGMELERRAESLAGSPAPPPLRGARVGALSSSSGAAPSALSGSAGGTALTSSSQAMTDSGTSVSAGGAGRPSEGSVFDDRATTATSASVAPSSTVLRTAGPDGSEVAPDSSGALPRKRRTLRQR